jgi:hypothetical protein
MQQGNNSSHNNIQNCMSCLSFFSRAFFFLSVWQHIESFFFPLRLFYLCRRRGKEKELRYSTQCLDNNILCVCSVSRERWCMSSLLLSLIEAFIDLHIVHFLSCSLHVQTWLYRVFRTRDDIKETHLLKIEERMNDKAIWYKRKSICVHLGKKNEEMSNCMRTTTTE